MNPNINCGHPLFPEPDHFPEAKVKMGVPHVVDFGQNMQHSPDGKAYLVAHGASDPDPISNRDADLSWITADEVYLARVKPSPHNMDDVSKYELFAGYDTAGKPIWAHDFSRIKPLLKWDNSMGSVTMTYDAPLKKYLMAVTDGGNTISKFNTYILESSAITGPFKLVTYMKGFGEQAYFVNFPSKFIGSDGKTAWLSYSANFTGSYQGQKASVQSRRQRLLVDSSGGSSTWTARRRVSSAAHKSGSKYVPYRVQIAHAVDRVRLQIAPLRPLIPAIDRKYPWLVAMLVEVAFGLLKDHLKKLGRVICQNRSKRIIGLHINIGLAGSRTLDPIRH